MGKKATVNGFTEGLSMDLNAFSDTKDSLIDALNATLVTGNGNEMILQNDDGNICLKIKDNNNVEHNVLLPSGSIPIGLKEYGGIFYICVYDSAKYLHGIYTYPSPDYPEELFENYIDWNNEKEITGKFINDLKPIYTLKVKEEDNTDKYKILPFITNRLNFSLLHPVDIEIQLSYDGTLNLILNDDYNIPRMINTGFLVISNNMYKYTLRKENSSKLYDSTTLEIFDTLTSLNKRYKYIPKLLYKGVLNSGNLKVGNYVFYFKYEDSDGNQTDIVQESGIVSCFKGKDADPMSINGGFRDENSYKLVQFELSDLDPGYDYIRVMYSRNTSDLELNRTTLVYTIDLKFKINTENKTCNIQITGSERLISSTVDELNLLYVILNSSKTTTQYDNILFNANVTTHEINYKELTTLSTKILPFALAINAKNIIGYVDPQTYSDNTDLKDDDVNHRYRGEYYNTKNIYYNVGYWNEEFYRFGIVYIYEDGSLSPVFNIRGKEGIPIYRFTDTESINKESIKEKILDKSNEITKLYETNSNTFNTATYLLYKDDTDDTTTFENNKGVCRIKDIGNNPPDPDYNPIYGIGFYMPEGVSLELYKYNIKGYFYVRLKRIPTILCLAYMMPNDPNSKLPCIFRKRYVKTDDDLSKINPFEVRNKCLIDTKHYDINLVGEGLLWHGGNEGGGYFPWDIKDFPSEFTYKTSDANTIYIEIPKDLSRSTGETIGKDNIITVHDSNSKDIYGYYIFTEAYALPILDTNDYTILYKLNKRGGSSIKTGSFTVGNETYTIISAEGDTITVSNSKPYSLNLTTDIKDSFNTKTSGKVTDLLNYLNYEGHLFYFPLYLPNSDRNNFYDEETFNYEKMINYVRRWSAYSPDFLLKLPYFNQFFTGSEFTVKAADLSSPIYDGSIKNQITNIIYKDKDSEYDFNYILSKKYLELGGDYSNNKYRTYYLDLNYFKHSDLYSKVHIVSLTDSSPMASTNDSEQTIFRATVGSALEAYRAKYYFYDYTDDDRMKDGGLDWYHKDTLLDLANIDKFLGVYYDRYKSLKTGIDIYNTTPIVRGIYSPYLGISMELTEYNKIKSIMYGETNKKAKCIGVGELINIYIPGFDSDINSTNVNSDVSIKLKQLYSIRMSDSSLFYAISDRLEINKSGSSTDICYRGDCFLTTFTLRLNRNFSDPSVPTNDIVVDNLTWLKYGIGGTELDPSDTTSTYKKLNSGDVNAAALGNWITFKCRSNYNTCIRSIDESHTAERALTGNTRSFYPLEKPSASGVSKIPESYVMNDGFNSTVGNKYYTTLDTLYVKNEFKNRIYYSNVSQIDSISNGYRVIKATHFRDFNPEYGNITKILTYMDNLIVIFEHGIGTCLIYEKNLISENLGSLVYINSNNILPMKLTILSDTIGSQWSESIYQTPYFIYGVDTTTKKIWRLNNNLVEIISDFKVEYFLNKNIDITEKDKYPFLGIRNIKTHYNALKSEVMFTFYNNSDLYNYIYPNTFKLEDNGYLYDAVLSKNDDNIKNEKYSNLNWSNANIFDDKEFFKICNNYTLWNLAYNEINKCFTTFYSWIPSCSGNINNLYYSFNNLTTIHEILHNTLHQVHGDKYNEVDSLFHLSNDDLRNTILYSHSKINGLLPKPTNWYGVQYPFEFEFTVRDDPSVLKIWNNLQIISNKAEPESFHFEIVGDGYDFKNDKANIYFRLEKTKELWSNLGSSIKYDNNFTTTKLNLLKVSTYFPLYYKRNKFGLDVLYSTNDCIHSKFYDWQYLSGSELVKDERELNYNIVTHIKCSNRSTNSILYSNSEYLEDRWNILIPLINMVLKNEAPWDKPPIIVDYIPNDLLSKDIDYSKLPSEYLKLEYWPKGLDLNKWTYNKQMPIRDKYIKIRIRYDGTEKAIISAIKTIYTDSYA